jgi:glutamate dehydrogenase/leucine dehydrogenase
MVNKENTNFAALITHKPMLDLLKKFEARSPEIIFEWNDNQTDAKGWIVINSLRGGAAGGGTRMRKGLDRHEVESLAKTMEIKFTVAGPQIGGAKSGINFDPQDPRKEGVLQRWFKAVLPVLTSYYGTGGDLFVDEIHEVIPITASLGLQHPQQGVVNGHYGTPNDRGERIRKLQEGVSMVVNDLDYVPVAGKFRVADMITGYGVAVSVIRYYRQRGQDIKGKRVLVQGWGNVGAAAGYYLAREGAKITGIIDRATGVINTNGYTFEETNALFQSRFTGNMFGGFHPTHDAMHEFWDTPADVFIPAAASRLVEAEQINKLIKNGLEVISCGANVPFADQEIFFGPIAQNADEQVSVIPDFISNCGMARVFAFLMSNPDDISAAFIFQDVERIISAAMDNVYEKNEGHSGITATAYEIALKKLV